MRNETNGESLSRHILGLTVPSLGSLLVEPLMVLVDSVMIGHLGTIELVGLTLASSMNVLVTGLCLFLVYGTAAVASRQLDAGDRVAAVKTGVDGAWLRVLVGLAAATVLYLGAEPIVALFGSGSAMNLQTETYLRAAAPGMAGMLLVLAGTSAMRGQSDARTPLVITAIGAGANVALNAALIYGADLGVTGAGLGTSLASLGMGAAFVVKIIAGTRAAGVSLVPQFKAILQALTSSTPLMIRTITMQTVILATLWAAAAQGEIAVAGRQAAAATWGITTNFHDVIAIATQALIGFELGWADQLGMRHLIRRVTWWGIGIGLVLGVVTAAMCPVWPWVFTSDPRMAVVATAALLVSVVFQPLAGVVFVLDGVLIGTNGIRYLAWVGLASTAIYVPALVAV